MTKKRWQEPELIILVRNKPEEAVLSSCKVGTSSGPTDADFSCQEAPFPEPCGLCSQFVGS